jgi:hypothetical protein
MLLISFSLAPVCRLGVSVTRKSELIGWKNWCNDIVIIIDERTATLTIPVWDW